MKTQQQCCHFLLAQTDWSNSALPILIPCSSTGHEVALWHSTRTHAQNQCDLFPTGPVGSLFLLVFNATSTSFIKPGQLKVPSRQQKWIEMFTMLYNCYNDTQTVLKKAFTMLLRRYFKKKKGSYCAGKLGRGRPNATTGRKGVTRIASTV